MNSRERVRMALNHQEPDRVPVDLGGMGSTGILGVAYHHLRNHLGLPFQKVRINDVGQQLADIHEDLMKYYGVDVASIHRTLPPSAAVPELMEFPLLDHSVTPSATIDAEMTGDSRRIVRGKEGWEILDEFGKLMSRKPDTSYYFDPVYHHLANATTLSDIADCRWLPPPKSHFETLRKQALYLKENTDYALMASFGGSILEFGQGLRGWEQFMLDLATGGMFTNYLLDYMANHALENLGLYMEALGDLIDVIVFGDDLGTQQAPQLSPNLYRKTIHPRHKRIYTYVRENYPNVHVFLHSCGSIYGLLPMLIEEGVQIINPVQTSAVGMEPAKLKKEFGRDLTFWGGGIDTQQVLREGSVDEVRRMVRERIEIFGEGGGFVFCQVHNVQAGLPIENIAAMMHAVRECNGL